MMSMPSRKLILFSMGLPSEMLITLLPKAPTAGTTATILESETTEQLKLSVVAKNNEHEYPGNTNAPDIVMTEPTYA
jgi:hypothetical protein